MPINEKIPDFITFPKTFENYEWYKPIVTIIITFIIMLILEGLIVGVFFLTMGLEFLKAVFSGGYEIMATPMGLLFSDLMIAAFIPALYIASNIVKDRPFSSYSSSRGGWNFKIFFRALLIAVILYVIYECIKGAIFGPMGTANISITYLLVLLIFTSLQAIAEEYIFRSVIFQTLGSWLKMPVLVLIIQAIIFALGHGYNSIGLFETLVTGLIYGFFTWKTNGIELSSAMHVANNFSFGLFVMLGVEASTSNPTIASIAAIIIFVLILSAVLYLIGTKTNWFGEIPENT